MLLVFCAGFSYTTWASSQGLTSTSALQTSDVANLLSVLGVSKYIQSTSCRRMMGEYENPYKGWKSRTSKMPNLICCIQCVIDLFLTKLKMMIYFSLSK